MNILNKKKLAIKVSCRMPRTSRPEPVSKGRPETLNVVYVDNVTRAANYTLLVLEVFHRYLSRFSVDMY